MNNGERNYQAAYLRADEVAYLAQCKPTIVGCPHLDVFYKEGFDDATSRKWRVCHICYKHHDSVDECAALLRRRELASKRAAYSLLILLGLVIGFAAGMAFYWWCVWRLS